MTRPRRSTPTTAARRSWRRFTLAVVAVVVTVVGAWLPAAPASAASHAGRLWINGPGSVYSEGGFISQSVAPGRTSTYSLKVVNSGAQSAQFLVSGYATGPDGNATSVGLYQGSTPLASLVDGGGYYTPPIAPGGSLLLSLRVTMPASAVWRSDQPVRNYTQVDLYATDGTYLSGGAFYTEVAAPRFGESAADLFAKQGTQLWVGGVDSSQVVMTSPAVKVGASTTFNLRLQNNGTAPGAISLTMYTDQTGCFGLKVLAGTKDVTSDALGEYTSPVLAVGQSHALKVVATHVSMECYDLNATYFVANGSGDRTEVLLVTPIPAQL